MRALMAAVGGVVLVVLLVLFSIPIAVATLIPGIRELLMLAVVHLPVVVTCYFLLVITAFVLAVSVAVLPMLLIPASLLSLAGVALLLVRIGIGVFTPVGLIDLATLVLLLALFAPSAITAGIGLVMASSGSNPAVGATAAEWNGRAFLMGANVAMTLLLGIATYPVLLGAVPMAGGVAAGNPIVIGVGAIALVLSVLFTIVLVVIAATPLGAPVSPFVKSILGYATPLLPNAWPVVGLGALFFIVDLALHPFSLLPGLGWLAVTRVSIRPDTCSVVHVGGLCSNLNVINTAYNMGNFVLIDVLRPTPHERTEQHEVGHQLSLAAFGSAFHIVAWADEFLGSAYAERVADGNIVPPPPRPAGARDLWN